MKSLIKRIIVQSDMKTYGGMESSTGEGFLFVPREPRPYDGAKPLCFDLYTEQQVIQIAELCIRAWEKEKGESGVNEMKMAKYETRSVFIVKDIEHGHIYKVFGIESEAERYKAKCDAPVVIDEWPCEFAMEQPK